LGTFAAFLSLLSLSATCFALLAQAVQKLAQAGGNSKQGSTGTTKTAQGDVAVAVLHKVFNF